MFRGLLVMTGQTAKSLNLTFAHHQFVEVTDTNFPRDSKMNGGEYYLFKNKYIF